MDEENLFENASETKYDNLTQPELVSIIILGHIKVLTNVNAKNLLHPTKFRIYVKNS